MADFSAKNLQAFPNECCQRRPALGRNHVAIDIGIGRRQIDIGTARQDHLRLAGFERGERYEVAMKVGELVLLPAVRNAPEDTLIVADGFSCREQIAQTTDRRALHLAEVLRMALLASPNGAAQAQAATQQH